MSQTPSSEPTPVPADTGPEPDQPESPQPDSFTEPDPADETQPTPQQPYDQLAYAQQYGQPPQEPYAGPEATLGAMAPLTDYGAQQYGQPEHATPTEQQPGYPNQGYDQAAPPEQHGFAAPPPAYGAPDPSYGYPQSPPYAGQQQPYAGPQQTYGAPQQPSYPPPGYASQPPYPAHQPPYATGQPYGQPPLSENDQRLWATLAHISIPFFGFVGPLVGYLALKDRSTWLRESLCEALNFSILVSVSTTVAALLTLVIIGYVLLPVILVGALVLCILAAIASNKGELYKYPVNWRLVQ